MTQRARGPSVSFPKRPPSIYTNNSRVRLLCSRLSATERPSTQQAPLSPRAGAQIYPSDTIVVTVQFHSLFSWQVLAAAGRSRQNEEGRQLASTVFDLFR